MFTRSTACKAFALACTAALPAVAQNQAQEVVDPNEPVSVVNYGTTSYAQPDALLYDNGQLINSIGTGVGGADESILQSTSLGHTVLGFGVAVSSGFRMSDDFTVTDPGGWQIDDITFFSYQTGGGIPSTINDVRVQIWDGDPSNPASSVVFGDTATNRLASTTWTNAYRVSETTTGGSSARAIMDVVATINTVLPAGTYWVDVNIGGTAASGPWAPPVTITGQAVTGDSQQWNPTTMLWGPATHGNGDACGLPFQVNGSVAGPACGPQSISSLYARNNGGAIGGMVYFNMNVANPAGVTVETIGVNTLDNVGLPININVYTVPGGFLGNEGNAAAWTLVSSGAGIGAGQDLPSDCDVADFGLAAGLWGVAIEAVDFGHDYTNGNGSNQNYFSADADLSLGKASNVPFTSTFFTPRIANVTINYCAVPGQGTNYCRATLSNRGCLPRTTSSGTASMTGGPGSFTMGCVDAPAKKNGFMLLSISGAQAVPFGSGTLCLDTGALFRLGVQNSGGGASPCDGAYTDDMGAVIAANPGIFMAGMEVFCQYLYRDQGLTAGQGLSDGHRFAIAP